TVSSPYLAVRADTTTLAPCLAYSRAMARPMPRPAPVISTTLSRNFIAVPHSYCCSCASRDASAPRLPGSLSEIRARDVTRRSVTSVRLAPAKPVRRLAGIAHPTPTPFLLSRDRKTADEVDHL